METDSEICEECKNQINCNKNNIYILTKGDEEKILCQSCFEDLWKQYSNDGWGGDDIDYYLELEQDELDEK
jgi:hypothetical protein